MKEKPILFNTEMVKAIIDGRKTQSRRPVKPSKGYQSKWSSVEKLSKCPTCYLCEVDNLLGAQFQHPKAGTTYFDEFLKSNISVDKMSPYGWFKSPHRVGDHLYVRETWAFDHAPLEHDWLVYRADGHELETTKKWKPSIHMPKKYARIWLEITDIRVERVRDVTEDEALKEGIISNQDYEDNAGSEDLFPCPMCNGMQVHGCLGENMGVSETDCIICDSQKNRFGLLWDSIYDNWSENPWVWVIEFKRIDK